MLVVRLSPFAMINGNYVIDGVDIWSTYGAVILKDSYNSLLAYPDRKDPDSNDWFEEDGLEVDLSNPKFEAKTVSLSVGIYADSKVNLLNKRSGLFALLSGQGYRSLYIKSLDKTWQLRYTGASSPSASRLVNGNQFHLEQELTFSMDNPLQNIWDSQSTFDVTFDFTFRGLSSVNIPISYKYINHNFFSIGQDIINYGMAVKSFNADALLFDSLKDPLIKSYSTINGNIIDVGYKLKRKEKTITLSIIMGSDTISDLFSNYSLFFQHISSNGLKTIHNIPLNSDFKGYYSKQSNLEIYGLSCIGGGYILEFDLEFIVTQATTL